MRLFLAGIFLLSLGITSCSNNEAKNEAATADQAPPAAPQSKLSDSATAQLMNVVTDYYQLKDAFVSINAAKADEAAKKLAQSAEAMKAAVNGDSSVGADVLPYLDTVSMGSEKLVAEQDSTIEKKKTHFEKVSDAMYVLLKNVDLKNAGVYRQFCPMAFDDKGAYWLSNESEIKNPYFGKKMLECGEVTDSLK
jgi:Cu(I)/Ag(I) efflux system membrane fusion protein